MRLAQRLEGAHRADQRVGKLWISVFHDKPVSKKPLEVRQGKGKGNVEYWVAQVQPGRMLYEIEGVNEELAREVLADEDMLTRDDFEPVGAVADSALEPGSALRAPDHRGAGRHRR